MSVKDNLRKIKSTLPTQVTLVAVSKTKPVPMILEAYEAGQRDFGENYVQELTDKYPQLPRDIRWHFIGHLQSNKVRYIAAFVHLVHGVDSLKLLQEINKQGLKNNRIINCLLQIHIAHEETKFGLSFQECEEILSGDTLTHLHHVRVCGFMAMASNTEDEEQVRNEFRTLKKFADSSKILHQELSILSFGMSGDYQIALEEGSTMVRIGSIIFGERNYP
jgi:PLP dependent protein